LAFRLQPKKGNHVNELAMNSQGGDESVRAAEMPETTGQAGEGTQSQSPIDDDPDDDGETEAEIEHAGEKYRIPKALKGAFLMHADYTRKTQEIAGKGRSLDERQNAFLQQERFREEHLDRLGQVYALGGRLAGFEKVNWAELRSQDPAQAQNLWSQYQQTKQTRDKALGQLQSEIQQKAFESQRDNARRVEQGHAAVARDIKDWNPEMFGKVRDFGAREFGFDPGEIAAVHDPRMLKVLHRAYLGDQAIKRAAASEKAAANEQLKPLPTVTGNSRGGRGPSDEQSVEEWMRRRNEQSRKKGH
jgi:hypothetical protein